MSEIFDLWGDGLTPAMLQQVCVRTSPSQWHHFCSSVSSAEVAAMYNKRK